MKPVISVIVVTYNQQSTIGRTLDSILSQKINVPFEIVIGDDCSSDRTSTICVDYKERYPDIIRYFRRDPNIGVVRNYFRCIGDCQGKYIADCAGDDYWVDRYKLRKQYDLLQSNPSISIVHTAWNSVGPDGKNPKPGISKEVASLIPAIALKGTMVTPLLRRDPDAAIHLCSAMFRKSVIDKELELNADLYVSDDYSCEDFQIIVALAANGSVAYIPDVSLHYTVAPGTISRQTDFRKKYRQVKGNLILTERLRKHYGVAPSELAAYYEKTADYLEAQVFHSGDQELLEDSRQLLASLPMGARSSRKRRLRKRLMDNPTSWRISRSLFGKKVSK